MQLLYLHMHAHPYQLLNQIKEQLKTKLEKCTILALIGGSNILLKIRLEMNVCLQDII